MNKFIKIIISGFFLFWSAAYAADMQRISLSPTMEEFENHSVNSSLSVDGGYVKFETFGSSTTTSDKEIYILDRDIGVVEQVAFSTSREYDNQNVYIDVPSASAMSQDGRYIAFETISENLVSGDTNSEDDVFVIDRETGVTERVSISSTGEQQFSGIVSDDLSISADGRHVVFNTTGQLVDGNVGSYNYYVRDRETSITDLVNISIDGQPANNGGNTDSASISADGRFVAFDSFADNLLPGDAHPPSNTYSHVYIRDSDSGVIERISVSPSGTFGNSTSRSPVMSSDGRFVAFTSFATNLVSGGTNGEAQIFIRDRQTNVTKLISTTTNGEQGNQDSGSPAISADGRFVVFWSTASNLVDGDTNNTRDIFVYDDKTGDIERINSSSTGEQANGFSLDPSISADGQFVAFTSIASNLVEGDTNDKFDVFFTQNPLFKQGNDLIIVKKLINNSSRETPGSAAQLATGTQYQQVFKVTNNSPNRVYQVKVLEDGNLVCNFYALNPGQSRQRCATFQAVKEGGQHVQPMVTAKVSGSTDVLSNKTDAYYTGLTNVMGKLRITHRINNINADSASQAPVLSSQQATLLFKVENTGEIELYQVKTYDDPVSPVNSGWDLQCIIGPMKPGQVRYCKKDIMLTEFGLNKAMGRVQGRNAIRSATGVVNASNPTYFILP